MRVDGTGRIARWISRRIPLTRGGWWLLAGLLLGDLVFVGLYAAFRWGAGIPAWVAHLGKDHYLPEFYQYGKEVAFIALAVLLLRRRRQRVYLAVALLGVYLLVDDAGRLHETLSKQLIEPLGLVSIWGLRAMDFGEMLVFAAAGLGFTVAFALLHRRTSHADRQFLWRFYGLILALAGVGIGVDMIHQAWSNPLPGVFSYTALEDGGEMVVMSMLVVLLLGHSQRALPGPSVLPAATTATAPARAAG